MGEFLKMKKTKVLIIDDHEGLRDSLVKSLESKNNHFAFYQASNKNEAITIISTHKDICIMLLDLKLEAGDLAGLEVLDEIYNIHRTIKTLVYTMFNDPYKIARALQKGVEGYITKTAGVEEILAALLNIESGRKYYCDEAINVLQQNITGSLARSIINPFEIIDSYTKLTPKEKEVFEYLAKGMNVKEVAFRLKKKTKTVENQRTSLYQKLGLKDKHELIELAKNLGIII